MEENRTAFRPQPSAPPLQPVDQAALECYIQAPPAYTETNEEKPPPYSQVVDPMLAQSSVQAGHYQLVHQRQQSHPVQQRSVHRTVSERKPSTYLGFSVFTMLFCNFICGLVALIFSCQSNSEWTSGNRGTARRHSRTALCCNVCALVTGLLTIGLTVVIVTVLIPYLKDHVLV